MTTFTLLKKFLYIVALLGSCICCECAQARPAISGEFNNNAGWFNFVESQQIGDIVIDNNDDEVVKIAANLLSSDFAKVFDKSPQVTNQLNNKLQIVAGTLGKSDVVAQLIKQYHINTRLLNRCFECYQFNFIVHNSYPILLITGADRRGAAYGLIELSRKIGVSPWVWWADVVPDKKSEFSLRKENLFFNSPSVKYRGIFINDEDFGLLPWAAHTFEKSGNIGPKTYEKIFELLLRLRANTLWPAMHEVTKPFNDNPLNAKNADRYAIIMGSSHAEPMLRNNVGEWKFSPETYNFITNKNGVLGYWEDRLKTNSAYENLYTVGMRGIHDSGVIGVKTLEEKQQLLNDVLKSQTQLLTQYLGDLQNIPQIFVPYKEVLEIYEKGLDLPANITIVWPDDNFGYIRRFASEVERKRSGGAGVYYHFSYLGAPLSYLWLATTPLDLTRAEMTRAYDYGAKTVWMFNVGDIKPAEINLTHAMDLAWDIEKTRKLTQYTYLKNLFSSIFGNANAAELASIMDEYFKVNFVRKPEHLQYFLSREAPRLSGLNDTELMERIARADNLLERVQNVGKKIPLLQRDSFFELIDYSVQVSALAHKRFAYLELYAKKYWHDPVLGHYFGNQAVLADSKIKLLTHQYNHEIQQGKWNYLLNEEPADNIFSSFRINKPILPTFIDDLAEQHFQPVEETDQRIYQAKDYSNRQWELYEGINAIKALTAGAEIAIPLQLSKPGPYCARVDILPAFHQQQGENWRVIVNADNKVHNLEFIQVYNDKNWAQGVLNNHISKTFTIDAKTNRVTLSLRSVSENLLLDKVVLYPQVNETCE